MPTVVAPAGPGALAVVAEPHVTATNGAVNATVSPELPCYSLARIFDEGSKPVRHTILLLLV